MKSIIVPIQTASGLYPQPCKKCWEFSSDWMALLKLFYMGGRGDLRHLHLIVESDSLPAKGLLYRATGVSTNNLSCVANACIPVMSRVQNRATCVSPI